MSSLEPSVISRQSPPSRYNSITYLSSSSPFTMSDEVIQAVIETIDNTNKHRIQLAELLECLQDAKHQVNGSAEKSHKDLQEHFQRLRDSLLSALNKRETQLTNQILDIKEKALQPLDQCEQMIEQELGKAAEVMSEGKQMLKNGEKEINGELLKDFKTRASKVDLISLPEVPSLAEVACISVEVPVSLQDHLVTKVTDHGRVISRGPVQISQIDERSGALKVNWAVVEEDLCVDISEYRLQYCCNMAVRRADDPQATFIHVYQGGNSSCVVRRLKPSTMYTFRICGRAEGAQTWSPWSVPYVAMTTLPHYEWQQGVDNYATSSDGKDTRVKKNVTDTTVLHSSGSCFICGHSIIFKVIQTGTLDQDDGIGLCVHEDNTQDLRREGVLFVTATGSIFIDGQEMLTKLPALQKNSSLTFDTEVLHSGKVRVTIELAEKAVTVDWSFERPTQPAAPLSSVTFGLGFGEKTDPQDTRLYFACRFSTENWKISVE